MLIDKNNQIYNLVFNFLLEPKSQISKIEVQAWRNKM